MTADPRRPFGWRFVTPLVVGATLNAVNSSMIATALVPISADLGVSLSHVVVLVACLYVTCAVAQPTMGRLGTMFGPRRVFVVGTIVVGIGAAVGGFASGLPGLIAARILIGIGTSAAYPNAMLLIRHRHSEHPDANPGAALGLLNLAAQVAAAAGLPLGGLLVGVFGWRAIFAANVPGVVVCLIATLLWIPRDERAAPATFFSSIRRLDPVGMTLFATAAALLVATMQTVPRFDVVLTIALGCSVVILTVWEWRHPTPFINVPAMIRNAALGMTLLRTALCYFTTYTMLFGFTIWLQDDRGLSEAIAGLVMLPMTVLAAPIALWISRRGAVWPPLAGAGVAFGTTGAVLFWIDPASPVVILLLVSAVIGVGLGLMSAGNQNALYQQSPTASIGAAAGTFRTFIYLGAILSSGFTSAVFSAGVTQASLSAIAVAVLSAGALLFALALLGRYRSRQRE